MAAYPGRQTAYWGNPSTMHPQHDTQENYGQIVSVTVPAGISGGETIHVLHPDQSGRVIEAVVPFGLTPGTKFYVQAPPQVSTPLPTPASLSPVSPLAEPVSHPSSWHMTPTAPKAYPSEPTPSAPPMIPAVTKGIPTSPATSAVPLPPPASHGGFPVSTVRSFHPAYDDAFTAHGTRGPVSVSPLASPIMRNDNMGMRLIKVIVPPGTQPGSTIHVQIPGENRLVAAQVPPHCTEFHIEYDPRETPTSAVMESPMAQQVMWSPGPTTTQQNNMLLVRVPRGTPPGARLHVQVPNEPGRLVEAIVPPNVSEFYVSYIPASPTVPVRQALPTRHAPPPPTTRTTSHERGWNNHERGWESDVLSFASGVASAVAGGIVYDHFAHHR